MTPHVSGQVAAAREHLATNFAGKTSQFKVRKFVSVKVAQEIEGAAAMVASELLFATSVAHHVTLEVADVGKRLLAYSAL